MSAETKDALERALAAHMADEFKGPVMLSGYILQACGQSLDSDGKFALLYDGLGDQSMVIAQGLLAYITNNVDRRTFDAEGN